MKTSFLLAVDDLIRDAEARALREERDDAARRLDDRLERLARDKKAADIDAGDLMSIAILAGATDTEVAALSARIDLHQSATIEAL